MGGFSKMEDNSELEEGEAPYYNKNVDNNIDPDTDLSYIDEKIQNILGHYLKDFEGGVSAENLGAKFGGYGSFLPTYERSPSSWSCPKYSQGDCTAIKSLHKSTTEGPSKNLKPTLNVPPSVRLGTSSCNEHTLQNSDVPSKGVSVSHDVSVSSNQVANKFTVKNECLNKSGLVADQRTLRLRIKMSSDKVTQKKVAIYSGLGLDGSPSSSRESADESGGINPLSRGSADESPASILQAMTSFPVQRNVLISPLHDTLFCLMRKETLSRYFELISSLKGRQDNLAMLAEESVPHVSNGKLLKENKAKSEDKSDGLVALKDGVDMKNDSGATFLVNEIIENDTSVGKKICSKDSRCASLPNLTCTYDSAKGTGTASEVSRGADTNEERYNSVSSNLPTEVLESISGKESGKRQKESGKCNLMGKVQKQRGINSHNNVLAQLGENEGKYNGKEVSAPLKVHSDGSICKEDMVTLSEQKVGTKSSIHVEAETNEGNGRTKLSSEGKKSKGNQTKGKVVAVSRKESLINDADLVTKGTMSASHDASTCKSKMLKLKSQKYSNGARDFYRESLDSSLELTNNSLERPSSDKPKLSSLRKFGVKIKHNALSDKSKENLGGKKVDLATPETSMKDDLRLGPCIMEGGHASETVPAATGLQDNWVLCDICQKWRLLPFGLTDKNLPEHWLCSMQNWLPGLNRCDISEDRTTKAIYALYQHPIPRGQHSVQENANGTASVITSVHGLSLEEKHQSVAVSIRGKKKHSLKEKPKAGGNDGLIQTAKSTRIYLQDSMKSRSLNDMNQPPAESNVVKTSSSLYVNKSCYLDPEKHVNGGDVKKLKMKNKRDADQHGYRTSKKAKIKDVDVADKHRKSDVDLGIVDLKPSAVLQTKASGKSMLKHEFSYSEDVKCDTNDRVSLSTKTLADQPLTSLDRGSLDMTVQDKRDNSVKKRKWQDNQNGHDSMDYTKEERSRSEYGKGHKSRVKKTDGKDPSANKDADSKANKNGKVAPVLSGCKSHPIDGIKDIRRVDKDHHLQKLRKKVVSQQISDGIDSTRCTSSSSKVSGSYKNGANFKKVKGSPVELVSSYSFRSFYTQTDTDNSLRKNDGGTDFLPVNGNSEKCWDGEGNGARLLSDRSAEKQFIPGKYDDSNVKLCASTNRKVASQQKLSPDIQGVIKANQLHIESVSHCVGDDGQKTQCDMSVPGSKQGRVFDKLQIDDSCKVVALKASTYPGNMGNTNRTCQSLDLPEVKDLNASSLRSMKSFSHNTADALKEAQELKDYADQIKNLGFVFECNEAYFQAALKFLHGASLLETCSGEGDRHGEMKQIQVYCTAAKLCEFCAHEYERRQDMAAAALAYKCMEVAYLRVVYCKHSSITRDRNELQATLNMASQGESPSSSASDVDNLNNQATYKATLFKSTVSSVTGNHGIVARNRAQLGRLLDFTQDVNFAMEASRKARGAFASANVIMEEAQNRERVTTVKRVIDFSFQDVEALIRLVCLAMESIKPLRFCGARD